MYINTAQDAPLLTHRTICLYTSQRTPTLIELLKRNTHTSHQHDYNIAANIWKWKREIQQFESQNYTSAGSRSRSRGQNPKTMELWMSIWPQKPHMFDVGNVSSPDSWIPDCLLGFEIDYLLCNASSRQLQTK